MPRYARGVARFEHVPPGERTPDPRPGDFILTHGGELFSRLTQIGQQLRYAGADQPYTYWNHAALIVSNDGALVEALGAGVHRTTLAAYDQTQYTVVAIDASAEDRAEMVEDGRVKVTCEFCSSTYEFTPEEAGVEQG